MRECAGGGHLSEPTCQRSGAIASGRVNNEPKANGLSLDERQTGPEGEREGRKGKTCPLSQHRKE